MYISLFIVYYAKVRRLKKKKIKYYAFVTEKRHCIHDTSDTNAKNNRIVIIRCESIGSFCPAFFAVPVWYVLLHIMH